MINIGTLIAISSLTVEAIGGTARDKGKNIYVLGLIGRMFNLNLETRAVDQRAFRGQGRVVKTAMDAFQSGYRYQSDDITNLFEFTSSEVDRSNQVVMSGNEATGYGLIAAGVRFGAGYPITPWSDIMELLRRELLKYGDRSSSARTRSRLFRWRSVPATAVAWR